MVDEAPLEKASTGGLYPGGPGWYVMNAADALWVGGPQLAPRAAFEAPGAWFAELGLHLVQLAPGQPLALYHREQAQEDFLVLAGEAVLVIEGQERALRAWDLVHCPAGTAHALIGAGDGPCLVLAVGARHGEEQLVYSVDPAAVRHGASVERETTDPDEAYAGSQEWHGIPCPDGFPPAATP